MTAHANTLSGDAGLALPEFDAPPADPIALLTEWFDSAVERQVREPLVVSLSSADADGRPSSRMILLKGVSERGLLFGSHRGSRKGRDFAERPWGAMTFYWRETLQQIVIDGPVEQISDEESDELFHARPRAAQATTAASQQSHPLDDAQALRDRAEKLAAGDAPVARPAGWGGYRLVPHRIEFWHGSPDRLHRRLAYQLTDGRWTARRLQP
ncbi:phenazine biosynthesis FMN-dependent oxidase PhzG [Microbispora sp. NBC_01189]|uniref:phenazine biosynthesis FMN-dependent oxidase PhzG n=1 Tax=Microbispora sp. NBC_01189 TaxID=2903583 RepID=UPI002E15D53F|nr:phenazine biosynthesis FMN-dependent oxidase PhzG [Microbispora sp. NBC_01189]